MYGPGVLDQRDREQVARLHPLGCREAGGDDDNDGSLVVKIPIYICGDRRRYHP